MSKNKPRFHPLALSLAMAMTTPAVVQAQQLIVTDGSSQTATGSYATTADGFPTGVALGAENNGSLINGDGITASSSGEGAVTVFAGQAGGIALSNSQIRASGANASAVWAETDGEITLTESDITATGASANGVVALDGHVLLTGGSIHAGAMSGPAIVSSGANGLVRSVGQLITGDAAGTEVVRSEVGGRVELNGGTVSSQGLGNWGLFATGDGSRIEAIDVEVTSHGDTSYNVAAADGGQVRLDNVRLNANGMHGIGIMATGQGSNVIATRTEIVGTGMGSAGAVADAGASVRLGDGSTVTTSGDGVTARGTGSEFIAEGVAIITDGTSATGALAVQGAHMQLDQGTSLNTSGIGAYGLVASDSGTLLSTGSVTVRTTGSVAPAAVALDGASLSLGQGTDVIAQGSMSNAVELLGTGTRLQANGATLSSVEATGIVMSNGANAALNDTEVAGVHAIGFMDTAASGDATEVTMSGGRLSSRQSTLYVDSGHARAVLSDDVAVGSDTGQLAYVKQGASMDLILRNASVSGDAIAEQAGALNITMEDGSALSGGIWNGGRLAMTTGSAWTLTASSGVAALDNAGTIVFGSPSANGFKTLTVNGDYTGTDGTLMLNAALGNDTSRSDRLVVTGNTSGNTRMLVNNVGGAGAATTNGIQVVQVDGASDGTFQLDGRAVAGSYEYLLHKGGIADPGDGDWYLRSVAATPGPDPTPDPDPSPGPTPDPSQGGEPGPAPAPVPVYRPETIAYLANQAAAVGMFQHSMHDRMGEPNFAGGNDSAAGWVRVVRNQMDGRSGLDQLDADTDTSVVQIGGELTRGDHGRWHVGLMGGTGQAQSHADSTVTGYRSKGKVKGYNLGVYGTWFANAGEPAGVYVDGWLQYGRYDQHVLGDYLREETYDATSWAASLEAGYAFALSEGGKVNLYLEPQVQAIYTDYSADDHVEANGTRVREDEAGGLTTRVGARFYGHAADADGNLLQPFVTVNWWHESDRNAMSFDGSVLKLELPRDRYEVKAGVQARLGGGWSGWGQLGVQSGADDYRDVNGQIGVNYRW